MHLFFNFQHIFFHQIILIITLYSFKIVIFLNAFLGYRCILKFILFVKWIILIYSTHLYIWTIWSFQYTWLVFKWTWNPIKCFILNFLIIGWFLTILLLIQNIDLWWFSIVANRIECTCIISKTLLWYTYLFI